MASAAAIVAASSICPKYCCHRCAAARPDVTGRPCASCRMGSPPHHTLPFGSCPNPAKCRKRLGRLSPGKAAITRIMGARAPRLAKTRHVQAQHGGQKHRRCFELRVMPGTKCASRAQALIGAVQSGPREVERLRCLRPLQFHSTQRLRMRTQARRERERRGDSTLPRGPSCARWQPHAAFEHAIRISCFAHQCRQAPRRCRVWTSRYRWEC